MASLVLDTNVVSYLFKSDSRGDLYGPFLIGNLLFISFMTVAELRRWGRERKWSTARLERMEQFLQDYTVYHSNDDLCDLWAEVVVRARSQGFVIEPADAWIAATALLYHVPLVTHNPRHFRNIDDLTILSKALP